MPRTQKRRALEGVRILDFSWGAVGPYANSLLALMGAEVIKVETRKKIDIMRRTLDPVTRLPQDPDTSPLFHASNAGKLGLTVNVSYPEAREVIRKLVAVSDAVVESLRPGVSKRLGLDYETLCQVNPSLVQVSVSAAGSYGPDSQAIGYAPTFAAMSGLGFVTGYPGGQPTEIRFSVDMMGALTNAYAIMSALIHRQRTGQGQWVDFSCREAITNLVAEFLVDYTLNGKEGERQGNRDEFWAPHNCYPCKGEDRWVSIAVTTEEEWRALCKAMGSPAWTKDPKFAIALSRWEHQDELDELISQWTRDYLHTEVMEKLQAVGVAAVPSFDVGDLYQDPHMQAQEAYAIAERPKLGAKVIMRAPWEFSRTPSEAKLGPTLGADNEYLLKEVLGLPEEQYRDLEARGVLE